MRPRHADALTSTINAHGICRECSKRTHLWLPGRLCTKCVKRHQAEMFEAMKEYDDG